MNLRRFHLLSGLWKPFTEKHPSLFAASTCFYILLSIFPSALFLLCLLSYFPVTLEHFWSILEQILPAAFLPLAGYLLETVSVQNPVALLSLSATAALWSASKGVLSLSDGLNAVLELPRVQGYLRRRLMAVFYFLLLSLSLGITLSIQVFGQQILLACIRWFPGLSHLWDLVLDFPFLYTILLISVMFAMIYGVFPSEKLRFSCCCLGGLAAAAGWVLFSALFSFYLGHFPHNLSLPLLICIWLQICIQLLLYGGILCSLLNRSAYHPIEILRQVFRRS